MGWESQAQLFVPPSSPLSPFFQKRLCDSGSSGPGCAALLALLALAGRRKTVSTFEGRMVAGGWGLSTMTEGSWVSLSWEQLSKEVPNEGPDLGAQGVKSGLGSHKGEVRTEAPEARIAA
eukprot:Hpha_TRINITY_DN14097_c0_g2::TRINITY_DN14097_c0_g2_i1::g.44360::m.44360